MPALPSPPATASVVNGTSGRNTTSWLPVVMNRVYTNSTLSTSPLRNRSTTYSPIALASAYVGFSLNPLNA